jgi:glycosyltransferase involved in cell wall biosynthesis
MRIGIVPALDSSSGGIYQYTLTMLQVLDEWRAGESEDEFVVFVWDAQHGALTHLAPPMWTVQPLPSPGVARGRLDTLRRLVGEGPHRDAWRWLRGRLTPPPRKDPEDVTFRPEMNRLFRDSDVKFLVYPMPDSLSFEAEVPYLMAIHDLQHRLQPEFPEVSSNGERESREYCLRNGSRYATLLLADSEVGREDILSFYGCYGVTPDRVKVLPFLPAPYLAVDVGEDERCRVRRAYGLPAHYIFYPAQFWPHKNHLRIVQALGLLRHDQNLRVPIVLCGSHSGEIRKRAYQQMMSLIAQRGLRADVHYLGYVPERDMSAIYTLATALVMPTFFGPTNIPVLEAWSFGCPVLTSNIRGIREQAEDAALLVDPRSVESIAEGIRRIWVDEQLRASLVERGYRRLASYTRDDYRRRLREILAEAKMRVASETPRFAAHRRA